MARHISLYKYLDNIINRGTIFRRLTRPSVDSGIHLAGGLTMARLVHPRSGLSAFLLTNTTALRIHFELDVLDTLNHPRPYGCPNLTLNLPTSPPIPYPVHRRSKTPSYCVSCAIDVIQGRKLRTSSGFGPWTTNSDWSPRRSGSTFSVKLHSHD